MERNKIIIILGIVSILLISGCAGGSYGTGKKTLQWGQDESLHPENNEEKNFLKEMENWSRKNKEQENQKIKESCPKEKQVLKVDGSIECF
ncbi:MAG: hypothetical protein SGJ02_14430 [bacterium]|nr:hypothetical protein [bacterium]